MISRWIPLLLTLVFARENARITIPNASAITAALAAARPCDLTARIVQSEIPMLQGTFGNNLIGNGTITLPIMLAAPDLEGCGTEGLNFTCPDGCIVLVIRGSCSFVEKSAYVNGTTTGVRAVIIYDNAPSTLTGTDDLVIMAGEDVRNTPDPGLPIYFMDFAGGDPIARALNAGISVMGQMPTTGKIDPNEWQALRDIANSMVLGVCDGLPPLYCLDCTITTCEIGDARPWNELMFNSTHDVDPCLSRIAGTQCIDGHIVEINFPYPLVGSLPSAIGNLPYLQTLILSNPGLTDDIGCVFQNLTRLTKVDFTGNSLVTFPGCNAIPSIQYLDLTANNLTSLPPGSLAGATGLQELHLGSNSLTSLPPEIGNFTNLNILTCDLNLLTALPPEIGRLTNLLKLDVTGNQITNVPSEILAIESMQEFYFSDNLLTNLSFTKILPQITVLWTSNNKLTTVPPYVAQMNTLQQIFLGENNISGPAPMFSNFFNLLVLGLNNNQFSGPVPTLDLSFQLILLYLFDNQFSGPLPDSWAIFYSLQDLRLQFNFITPPIHIMRGLPSLLTVDLSHNNLSLPSLVPLAGPTDAGAMLFATVPASITSINMAYNNIAGDIDTTWSGPLRALAIINISHNQITSSLGITALPLLRIYDASDNNLQYVDEDLPTSVDLRYISYSGNPQLRMQSLTLPIWLTPQQPTVLYADTSLLCLSVGLSPDVAASASFNFQIFFDPAFFSNRYCECIPGTYGTPPNCDVIPNYFRVNSTNDTVMDSDFGIHRQIAGADIVFGSPPAPSSQKVRVTILELSLGPDFTAFTDLVEVYAGDETLKGPRLISLRGTDDKKLQQLERTDFGTLTELPAHNISGVVWPSFRLNLYSDEIVIHFQSRDETGQHFSAEFSYIHNCPTGLVTHDTDPYLTCTPIVMPFITSDVVKGVLYFLVALGALAICITLGLFIKFQKTRVVRAASPLFSVLTLVSLLIFLCGSLLYAATPDTGICHARVWITFAPLVALLSFFLSKVNRIRSIFGSTKLKSNNRSLRATRLLQLCAILVSIMLILLIIYSSVPLTVASEQETSERNDDGSLTIFLEQQCVANGDAPFLVWCTFTGLYIFGILVWGIYNAYAIRNTPSAFNESTHILQCLVGLLTLVVLCALFIVVLPNNPNLVLVVWGLGQALAAIFIFSTLFGPKLVALAKGGQGAGDANVTGTNVRSSSNLSGTMRGSETGSFSHDDKPKTELEIMTDRLDQAEKALKAQRAEFERMFREWGWTGEFN